MPRMIYTLLLIQSASLEPSLGQVLVQLPLVGIVVWLWVMDRRSREAQQKASDERYEALVQQVVKVVQENAAASATLNQLISSRPCIAQPGGGK